jgi:hypothetical protein
LSENSDSIPDELLGCVKGGGPRRSRPSSLADVEVPGAGEAVDAAAIVKILNTKGDVPPKEVGLEGLCITGAWIRDALDLDGISTTIGLRLTGCRLDQPLTLCDAVMSRLVLDRCVLPGVWADRAKVDTLTIQNCKINGEYAEGTLSFADAHVAIDLRLSGTDITNHKGPAVQARGIAVDAGAYLDGLDATGTGPAGAVCLVGATIGGDLVLHGAALDGGDSSALDGGNLTVKGAAFLDGDFRASGGGELGAVHLAGASITRQLSLRGAALTGRDGPALGAELLTVQGSLLLDGSCRATGVGKLAAVLLKGAKVSGDLRLDGVTIANDSGPALAADLITVQGDLTMTGTGRPARGTLAAKRLASEKAAAEKADGEQPDELPNVRSGAGQPAVQLRGAGITGQFSLKGATVVSHDHPDGQPSADTGAAVCLSGATITGDLVVSGATLESVAGPALLADYLTVKGDAFRCEKGDVADCTAFSATGQGELGAVCLAGATITGQVAMRGAILTGCGGPALTADSVTVTGDMLLGDHFRATGVGRLGTVRLRGATLNGRLSLDDSTVICEREDNPISPAYYHGALYLTGATIGHDLLLRRATLTAVVGPALRADYLTIKGDAFHCEARGQGVTATGTGELGALYLNAASFSGRLSLNDATLINKSGPALLADSATVAGNVLLGDSFTAEGGIGPDSPRGAPPPAVVSLVEASVGKELHCTGQATRLQPGVSALDLRGATVGTLYLSREFAVAGTGGQGDETKLFSCDGLKYTQLPVLLAGAPPRSVPGAVQPEPEPESVPGAVEAEPESVPGAVEPEPESAADAVQPEPVADAVKTKEWISYLRDNTVYSAQSYQQLASAYHALGNDDDARRILVAQRDEARRPGRLSRPNRYWQFMLRWLIGYGYYSVWALYWLAGLSAGTILLTISWFGPSKLIQPVASTTTTTAAAGSAATATATPTPTPTPSSTATTTTTKTPVSSLTTTTATARQPCSFMGQLGYAVNVSFPIITIDTNSVQQCDVAAPDPNPALVVFGWLVKALASTLAVIYAAGLGGLTTRSPGS